MKVNEFIEKVNRVAWIRENGQYIEIYSTPSLNEMIGLFLILNPHNQDVIVNHDWSSVTNNIDVTSLFYILGLVQELKKTPVDQRFDEPKYRVRLKGFNSDNGPQYLTAEKITNSHVGKLFACAFRSDLKQEFTENELRTIKQRQVYQRYGWIKSLIDDPKNLEKVGGWNV